MATTELTYDLNVLLDPEVAEDQRERILADVEAMVAESGTIVSAHDWGRRKMAYEIRHKTDADYHLVQFQGPRELLDRLDRTLRITDGVVRYRIIKLRAGTTAARRPRRGDGPTGIRADARRQRTGSHALPDWRGRHRQDPPGARGTRSSTRAGPPGPGGSRLSA